VLLSEFSGGAAAGGVCGCAGVLAGERDNHSRQLPVLPEAAVGLSARCIMFKPERPRTMTPDEIQKAIDNLDALAAKRYELTRDEILQELVKYDYIVKDLPDALTSKNMDHIGQLAQASYLPGMEPQDRFLSK
jgi:hypothetical protein